MVRIRGDGYMAKIPATGARSPAKRRRRRYALPDFRITALPSALCDPERWDGNAQGRLARLPFWCYNGYTA